MQPVNWRRFGDVGGPGKRIAWTQSGLPFRVQFSASIFRGRRQSFFAFRQTSKQAPKPRNSAMFLDINLMLAAFGCAWARASTPLIASGPGLVDSNPYKIICSNWWITNLSTSDAEPMYWYQALHGHRCLSSLFGAMVAIERDASALKRDTVDSSSTSIQRFIAKNKGSRQPL